MVDYSDDLLTVYYSTRIDGRSYPMNFMAQKDNPASVLSAPHEPLLLPGCPGAFDHFGVMPTNIIDVGTEKRLYYIGWSVRKDVPYHNSLGLAISTDGGRTYKKHGPGPVLSTCRKEPGFVGTACVRWDGKRFMGYYLSCQEWRKIGSRLEAIYDIKLAVSQNGIDWIPTGVTCLSLRQGEGGISQACVRETSVGTYEMHYSFRGESSFRAGGPGAYRIGRATSPDGLTWKRDLAPALEPSLEGWDSEQVASPYIISSCDIDMMFYNGNGFGKSGIGYAIRKSALSAAGNFSEKK